MDWNEDLGGWLAALGIGLLIGVVRERHGAAAGTGSPTRAGLRTHALLALVAAAAVAGSRWANAASTGVSNRATSPVRPGSWRWLAQ